MGPRSTPGCSAAQVERLGRSLRLIYNLDASDVEYLFMQSPLVQAACGRCRKSIDADDAYCRHCGARQAAGDNWYYSTAWIAFLAFVVIGPFALILVWKSTRMGVVTKMVMAALIVVYTVVLSYYFYETIILLLAAMAELNEVMGRY